jgi:alpha-ketoglutarate-dependent taurine dioxygenase
MKTAPMQDFYGTFLIAEKGETVNDIDADQVFALLKERGTVIFKDFKASKDDFNAVTERLTPDYMNYKGGGYVRKSVGDEKGKELLSTRYDHGREKQMTFGLPLHGEMYYIDQRPVVLWFLSVKPADDNGETTACDGAEVFKRLPQSVKDTLLSKRLMFKRNYKDGEWQKIYQTEEKAEVLEFTKDNGLVAEFDEADTLHTRYYTHAVLPTRWGGHTAYINNLLTVHMQMQMGRGETSTVWFEDGSPIPVEMMAEIEKVQNQLIYAMPCAAGDFVLMDNTRAMHGRNAFEDTEREVYLRMIRSVPF